jgi:hypothetical protein
VSGEVLNDGRPLAVEGESDRIGRGAWARLLADAVVRDESSSTAERGRALARAGAVHTVRVARAELTALVAGENVECGVTISAQPVPPRIWTAMVRAARGNGPLEAGVEGRQQSVQLAHLMTVDWEEPLVPAPGAIRRTCTCDAGGACEHVAALAYVVADAIDGDPSLLLRFRGCVAAEEEAPRPAAPAEDGGGDPWSSRPLPTVGPPRSLPAGAVLKRLGPSDIRVGGHDLAEVLQRAYAAFARDLPDS